jgi:acetylornithine deacetylase/succinyl-diaminopimelate desuccinylase family protein
MVRAKSSTPPGDVTACSKVITDFLDGQGIEYSLHEKKDGVCNVVARLSGSCALQSAESKKTLILNGHIDTVPAGNGWADDPFSGTYRDGELWGRGSVDMKGGVAALLISIAELKAEGAPFCGELILTAVGDEEYHSQWGTKYLLSNGLKGDFAINAEPTGLEFCLGNRGLLMVDLEVYGRASHGGRPHLGDNAVSKAASIIRGLDRLDFSTPFDDKFEVPRGSLSVVGIKGGARENVIPEHCSIFLDRRLMPGESGADAVADIVRVITDETGIVPDVGELGSSSILVRPEYWHEACWTPEEHPFIKTCSEVYAGRFGRPPVCTGKAAGTDASHLANQGGMPTLIFGPGDFHLSHTNKERIQFSQVLEAVDFYKATIKKVLND